MKKYLAVCLSLVMTISLLTATVLAASAEMPSPTWSSVWPLLPAVRTYEDTLTDAADAWCSDAIVTVYEAGLMEGRTATRFDISSPLTNAQIVVITARLHSLLRDGDGTMPEPSKGESWYRPALTYLLSQELTDTGAEYQLEQLEKQADDTLANQPCTREDFVELLDSVLTEEPYPREVLNPSAVPPDSRNKSVVKFYQAGILMGSDPYGTFHPSSTLTRGAAAAILARLAAPLEREQFDLLSFDLCRDILGVEPETVLLTVDGEAVTAQLFANQLCTSLYQWEGTTGNALDDAIRFWCYYYAPFQVMAEEKGIALSKEELGDCTEYGQSLDGHLGLPSAYWQQQKESSMLNEKMRKLYYEADWKSGESIYHSDLEKLSDSLLQKTTPTDALRSMDLSAVYKRLMASPFVTWNF